MVLNTMEIGMPIDRKATVRDTLWPHDEPSGFVSRKTYFFAPISHYSIEQIYLHLS